MANEFFLLTWYGLEQMALIEGFMGIGAASESTFEGVHVVLCFWP